MGRAGQGRARQGGAGQGGAGRGSRAGPGSKAARQPGFRGRCQQPGLLERSQTRAAQQAAAAAASCMQNACKTHAECTRNALLFPLITPHLEDDGPPLLVVCKGKGFLAPLLPHTPQLELDGFLLDSSAAQVLHIVPAGRQYRCRQYSSRQYSCTIATRPAWQALTAAAAAVCQQAQCVAGSSRPFHAAPAHFAQRRRLPSAPCLAAAPTPAGQHVCIQQVLQLENVLSQVELAPRQAHQLRPVPAGGRGGGRGAAA